MPVIVDTVEEEIMKEISADTGISYNIIRDVVINGQSEFTKHVIESGEYDSVRWPHFGTFKLKYKFMLIKKHITGMAPIYRKIYRRLIKEGKVFNNSKK